MQALSARDAAAVATALRFPHVRLAEGALTTWDTPEHYFDGFQARVGDDWDRWRVEDMQVLRACRRTRFIPTSRSGSGAATAA